MSSLGPKRAKSAKEIAEYFSRMMTNSDAIFAQVVVMMLNEHVFSV
jgi:hypothetical protein